jgi:hypothetical protein
VATGSVVVPSNLADDPMQLHGILILNLAVALPASAPDWGRATAARSATTSY